MGKPSHVEDWGQLQCWAKDCRKISNASISITLLPGLTVTLALCPDHQDAIREWIGKPATEEWPASTPDDADEGWAA